jgi:hypothetical protein
VSWHIVAGDTLEGFTEHGPFDSHDAALAWASENLHPDQPRHVAERDAANDNA